MLVLGKLQVVLLFSTSSPKLLVVSVYVKLITANGGDPNANVRSGVTLINL